MVERSCSPLEGMFDGRYKLVVAPRPELYDLAADPGETRNLLEGRQEGRAQARRLTTADFTFVISPSWYSGKRR